jgi:SAM-dependent methyltransferase
MQTESYILDSTGDAARRARERERLDILHAATGAWAARLLAERGAAPGRRCLDVGAGAGHISRWLAGRGATVVATDVDTHFLDALSHPAIDVRRHDILEGPVDDGPFDLVVARAVVVHVRDRERALRGLAGCVKPGGWLVVLDPSLPRTPRVLHASDPGLHNRVFAAWGEHLVDAGMEWDAARAVPMAEALGLHAGGEGLVQVLRGGEAGARLWSLTLAATAGLAVEAADVDRLVAMMHEPDYRAVQLLGFATWARR